MVAHKYQSIANRYTGRQCTIHTLNGPRLAIIAGRLNRFATIAALGDAGATQIAVNWPTVARKMESGDRTFYAC